MAEIGAALREARTRQRIEIAQMEAQSKIRAKYLRALENEEWELLPGPTYVKSFLRTYGDMLGIDGRQLVAEYKSAHEPFQAADDIGQISKHTGGRMNRSQTGPPVRRLVAAGVVLAALAGGGAYVYLTKDDAGTAATTPTPAGDATDTGTVAPAAGGAATSPASSSGAATTRIASVVVTATAPVTVCVRAGRRIVQPVRKMNAGERSPRARGKTVVVTATSRSVKLSVNGKHPSLPKVAGQTASASAPITVTITAAGVKRAAASVTACSA